MASFNDGDRVRLKVPVIEGGVNDVRFNKDERELEYLVSYTDEAGEENERWFPESKLEAAPAEPAVAAKGGK